MPPLKPNATVPVPAPTEPSSTAPLLAFLIAANTSSRVMCRPLMSFRYPSFVSPTSGLMDSTSSFPGKASIPLDHRTRLYPRLAAVTGSCDNCRDSLPVQLPVQQQYRPVEDFGSVGHVLPRRELLGGVADALFAGDKDHRHWRDPGDLLRVVPSEAGQVCRGEAERLRHFAESGLQTWVCAGRFRVIQQAASGLDVFLLVRLCEPLLDVLPHAVNLCTVEVAQLDREFCAAGDNVDRSGLHLDISHVAHLTALFGPHHVAHDEHIL